MLNNEHETQNETTTDAPTEDTAVAEETTDGPDDETDGEGDE